MPYLDCLHFYHSLFFLNLKDKYKSYFFFLFTFRDLTSDHKNEREHLESQRLLQGGTMQLLQAERKGMT